MATARAVTNEYGTTIANAQVLSLKQVSYRDLINTSEVDVKDIIKKIHDSRDRIVSKPLEHLAYHFDGKGILNIMAAAIIRNKKVDVTKHARYFRHRNIWYLYTDDWLALGQGDEYRIIKRTDEIKTPEEVRKS